MAPDEVLEESRSLRHAMRPFATRRSWLEHPEAAALQQRLQHLLQEVRITEPEVAIASGSSASEPLRYVHWNILHGNESRLVLEALQTDEALRDADLIALNEVDIGMHRSGNIDICNHFAQRLGMHAAWCALFLELHDHPDDREALFGLCLLSRYPLAQPRRLTLETPSDLLFDREGKVGDFVALSVMVMHPLRPFRVIVTHLDVHGTPARRRRQMQQILEGTPPGPAILSGDLNTTTMTRGNLRRTVRAFTVLALSRQRQLRRRLLRPQDPPSNPREPLFEDLRRHGFSWDPYNEDQETLDLLLKDIQEAQALPGPVRRLAQPLLSHVERRTHHRLDWIVGRGLPAVAGSATTRVQWMRGPHPASDHAPIACSFNVAEPTQP